jgi:hypothetical protein
MSQPSQPSTIAPTPVHSIFHSFSRAIAYLSPIAAGAILLIAAPAQAFQFGSNNITGNNATNALAGTQQLRIDVTAANGSDTLTSNQVLFKFSNIGTAASSITQIYFDNGTALKSVNSIFDSGAGVDFSQASGNLNLPGGNSLTSKFVSDFGIKANTPVSQQGVNNGTAANSEWVSVLFDLGINKTLQSVIDEMRSGALRIGMHVQAFSDTNGGSEAFVNKPTITPLPVVTPPVVIPPVVTPPVVTPPVVTPPVVTPPVVTPPVVTPPVVTLPVVKPPKPIKVPEPSTIVALSTLAIGAAMKRRRDANR